MDPYDVIVVGGGPAGLSAALVLGRCRRSVLVLDDGQPRNACVPATHGYLTRDGTPPLELLGLGREELERYGVEVRAERAVSAHPCHLDDEGGVPGFDVTVSSGDVLVGRKLLLATGVTDELPEVEGMQDFYGRGVFHCPYCDGWEHRDGALAVYGSGEGSTGLALALLTWSSDVTLLTDGVALDREARDKLDRNAVDVVATPLVRLFGGKGDGRRLEGVELKDGRVRELDALFFSEARRQHSELPALLGCEPDERGEVPTDRLQHTDVPGLFLAGDADGDVQFVVVAAAEGAKAAVAINIELNGETLA